MFDVTVEQYRAALAAVGARPLGSAEYKYPDVLPPSWQFRWTGPGSLSSMFDGVFGLLDRLGIERWNGEPLAIVPPRHGDGHSDSYRWPVRDLNGELCGSFSCGISVHMSQDLSFPSGIGIPATLAVDFGFHWLSPLSPGLFHDNREWSAVNQPLVREFFVGLRDLGFVYGQWAEESRISPLDAFGFVDVDVDGLKAEVAETWRNVVEGRFTYERLTMPPPLIPKGNPIVWSLLGFEWSEQELFELYDGLTGGEETVRRLLPRQKIVTSPQVVGDRDDLLETATELRDQLAVALAGFDDDLATRYRSLPVVMQNEVSEQDRKNPVNSSRIVQDILRGVPADKNGIAPLNETHLNKSGTDRWVLLHLVAPTRGIDCDLSAAVSLWGKSGELVLSDNALFVKLSSDHWVKTSQL